MLLDATFFGVIAVLIFALSVWVFVVWKDSRVAHKHVSQIFQQQELVRSYPDVHRLSQAIHLLCPSVRLGFDYVLERDQKKGEPYIAAWHTGGCMPTQEELDEALARLVVIENRGYAAMRRTEYPSVEDQLDAAYKARQGDDTEQREIDARITEVKSKYPKSDEEL